MNNNAIDNILSLFKAISLPCGNKRFKGAKEEKIISLLQTKYPNIRFEADKGIIIPSEEAKKVVIVSHYDLIPIFKKGFQNNKAPFSINEEGVIQGALDNTITNAILIHLLLTFDKPANVEILFSNMEEIGCIGMNNYLQAIPKEVNKEKDLFFINLDVTNDNWKNLTSIEMDEPIYEVVHFLNKNNFKGITEEREGDDLCEVVDLGFKGFSFCLPTKKTIHSWKNKTTLNHLEMYTKQLLFLIENSSKLLELSQEKAFSYISIKQILKHTKKEIEEYQTPTLYDYYGYNFSDAEYEEDEERFEIYYLNVESIVDGELEKSTLNEEDKDIIFSNFLQEIVDSIYSFTSFTAEDVLFDVSKKHQPIVEKLLHSLYVKELLLRETIKNKAGEKKYYYSSVIHIE